MKNTFRCCACYLALVVSFGCDGDDEEDLDGATRLTGGDIELGSVLPPDVDPAEQARLTLAGKYPFVQRLFDELSWQSFIALSWPQTAGGEPAKRLTDGGSSFWETYSESYEVFKPDGSAPDPYGAPRTTLPSPPPSDVGVLGAQGHRVLFNLSSTDGLNVLDEVDQAFSSPLWDQNGNMVHYEILLNQPEYDYINTNSLYNRQGQVAYFGSQGAAQFPSGQFDTENVGAVEVKLAWRILTDQDVRERYVVRPAYIIAGNPAAWVETTVGLVGMHIAHKTESSPQWIWSTFEHVDNLNINSFAAFGPDSADHPKKPSFYDPNCEYCPVNVVPTPDENGVQRTQVSRAVEIPKATQEYNSEVRALLASLGSPLSYYELINTQWPTEPTAAPAAFDAYPDNITNKSGGKPTPVYLISSVMETYFQSGATGTTDTSVELVVDGKPPVVIPRTNGGNTPLEYAEGACISVGPSCGDAGQNLVLSTESCMGCHSSAPLYVSGSGSDPDSYTTGMQLSGDFSWLLGQKAQPLTTP
jgi:hypothetical protein